MSGRSAHRLRDRQKALKAERRMRFIRRGIDPALKRRVREARERDSAAASGGA